MRQIGSLPVYIRNASVVGKLFIGLVFLSFPALVLAHPSSPLYYPVTAPTRDSVVLVASALAFVHVLITKDYFSQKRYQEIPPTAAARSAAWLPLAVIGLVGVLFFRDENTAQSLLATWPELASYAIVLTKLLVATAAWQYRGRLVKRIDDNTELYDIPSDLSEALQVTTLPTVERPTTTPITTVSPSSRRLVLNAPIHGATVPLRHGTLQYELYDDRIVCYDWWQEEPVWALDYGAVTGVSHEQGIAGRIGGYGTVVLETDEDPPARLLYLPAHERVAEDIRRLLRRHQPRASGNGKPAKHGV